jgi:hypothetical protein
VFTRQGHDGIRHVEVRGLIAAVFVHRDSRAGDPNLHTHVAIANKVQTLAGDWLAIDAQVLYRAKVSLSEEYTTQPPGPPDGPGVVVRGDRPGREAAGLRDRRCRPAPDRALVIAPPPDHRPDRGAGGPVPSRSRAAADTGREARPGPTSHPRHEAGQAPAAQRVRAARRLAGPGRAGPWPGELGRMLTTVLSSPGHSARVDEKFVVVAER